MHGFCLMGAVIGKSYEEIIFGYYIINMSLITVGVSFVVLLSLSIGVPAFNLWRVNRRPETFPRSDKISPQEIYSRFVKQLMLARSAEQLKEASDSNAG